MTLRLWLLRLCVELLWNGVGAKEWFRVLVVWRWIEGRAPAPAWLHLGDYLIGLREREGHAHRAIGVTFSVLDALESATEFKKKK